MVVPSYFDYIRLRNFLTQEETGFAGLNEYADLKDLARGRSLFSDGRRGFAIQGLSVQWHLSDVDQQLMHPGRLFGGP